MKLDGTTNVACHVDADFAALHGEEPQELLESAKLRHAWIVKFGGVPVLWKTQLILEICLSTTHVEHVGLLFAVRGLIPLRKRILDATMFHDMPALGHSQILCKVFEDNQSACLLATNQQTNQRTRHFNIKCHFFWSCVFHKEKNPNGWIIIEKIDTKLQDADCLTKGMTQFPFEENRKRVQGW